MYDDKETTVGDFSAKKNASRQDRYSQRHKDGDVIMQDEPAKNIVSTRTTRGSVASPDKKSVPIVLGKTPVKGSVVPGKKQAEQLEDPRPTKRLRTDPTVAPSVPEDDTQ